VLIKRLRGLIVSADFQTQGCDAATAAKAFGKSHHTLAEPLAPERLAQVKLVQQAEATMKFQTETERQGKVPSELLAAKDEVDLAVLGMGQDVIDRGSSSLFVENHVLLRIEFAHHLEKGGDFLIREELEENVHGPILN